MSLSAKVFISIIYLAYYSVSLLDVPIVSPITPISQQKQYQEVVIKDLVDSEKAHVAELQGLITNFLVPLEKSSM